MSNEKITVIDGVKYREVKRKAAVGEKIKVVAIAPASRKVGNMSIGEVFTVNYVDYSGDVWMVNEREFNGIISPNFQGTCEYVVLEPITESSEPPSDIAASDAELIVLQREINEVKRQITELTKTADGLTDALAKLIVKGTVAPVTPKLAGRDAVVKRAADDVADLLKFAGKRVQRTLSGKCRSCFWPFADGASYIEIDHVRYEVNRDKRTVVALICDSDGVWARGIAKAAPGDVFNEIIGKAIALRRALGLPVPIDYVNCPKPEGVRVGDVYEAYTSGGNRFVKTVTEIASGKLYDSNLGGQAFTYIDAGDRYGAPCTNPTVIDDSARYDVNGKVAE